MKFFISLLLVTMSASLAYAQSIIPISCNEISSICIDQDLSSGVPLHSKKDGYVYLTTLKFKSEHAEQFRKFTDPNKIATIYPDGTRIEYRPFLLLTPAGIVSSDKPYQVYVNKKNIILIFTTKERAWSAAQKVCPQIKPKTYFMYDNILETYRRTSFDTQ